ncbi:MAG TPA: hypothetical protein VEK15_18015 [Vicinamibacteria bacterium]|nr:hypothetical protein [Vicinamibacteria bacterium]
MSSLIVAVSFVAVASSSFAQEKRVEVNPFFGYTLSDGVTVDPFVAGGQIYDSINPKSGMGFGIQFGVFVTEQVEVGFLWARQSSKLEAKNGTATEFTDMDVDNYHGIFTYNWLDESAIARPFLFGGLGVTNFAPADIGGFSIDSVSRFSSTWGGGVKVYPSQSVGFTAMARWTPNYIKSDPAGIWCSPYWFYGCYVVGDSQYANQFEMTGGVSFRF